MEQAGYTVNKELSLYSLLDAELEYSEGFEETYERVKAEMQDFRSFGEGLKRFMEMKAGTEISDPVRYLLDQCKANGVPIEDLPSARSMRAWYAPKKPRKNVKKDTTGAESIRSHQAQYARLDRSANGRLQMFAIAFALGLSKEETSDLFHKVYLDRAFHPFIAEESVFYYCLQTGKNYATAKRLIEQLKMLIGMPEEPGESSAEELHVPQPKSKRGELIASAFEESHGNSTDTAKLLSQIDGCTDDDQLLECLQASAINFRRPYKKAIEKIKHYKTSISCDMAAELYKLIDENSQADNEVEKKIYPFIASENLHRKTKKRLEKALGKPAYLCDSQFYYLSAAQIMLEEMKEKERDNCKENRVFSSTTIRAKLDGNEISFRSMFDILLTMPVFEGGQNEERLVPFNPALMAEIKRAFPGPETLSKVQRRKATFDEMRSLIILLFSVDYWKTVPPPEQGKTPEKTVANITKIVKTYSLNLNKVLKEAQCPGLYCGNPFDFLFLYCTGSGNPLDALRAAVGDQEVINSEVSTKNFSNADDDSEDRVNPAVVTEKVSEAGNDSIETRKQDAVPPESIEDKLLNDLLELISGN